MGAARIALKSSSWLLRLIEFCTAIIILGIFAYFIAVLRERDIHVPASLRAVVGISGAAAIYTIFALFLVWVLGGIAIFSIVGIILDILFMGAFIYLAYAARHGANSCSGRVRTPIGDGDTNGDNRPMLEEGKNRLPSLRTSCKLNTACFSVAIVGLVFFLFSALLEYFLLRQRRREKSYQPSPEQGFGTKRKFWQRKPKRDSGYSTGTEKRHGDSLPSHSTPGDVRASYATDVTAAGHEQPVRNQYDPTLPAVGQGTGPGYTPQTAAPAPAQYGTQAAHTPYGTTTQAPYAAQGGQAPYSAGGRAAEMPATEGYRTYNPDPTRTF